MTSHRSKTIAVVVTVDTLMRAYSRQEVQERLRGLSPASLDRLLASGQLAVAPSS